MWRLLTLLALGLGAVGLGRAELSAAQQQGLQVALEEFHKHPRVQWAFQKTSVDSATDTVSSVNCGREGVGAAPQEARTFPGSRCESARAPCTPSPREEGHHPGHQCSRAVSLWGGGTGHTQELFCPPNWLLAFFCPSVLSVGSPTRRGPL